MVFYTVFLAHSVGHVQSTPLLISSPALQEIRRGEEELRSTR